MSLSVSKSWHDDEFKGWVPPGGTPEGRKEIMERNALEAEKRKRESKRMSLFNKKLRMIHDKMDAEDGCGNVTIEKVRPEMVGLRRDVDSDSVLDFIHRRFPIDCHWMDGNCYYFALILTERFPQGKIVYDVIEGHFACEIGGVKYDWSGVVKESGLHKWVEWDKFIEYDNLQFERVVKDCTL